MDYQKQWTYYSGNANIIVQAHIFRVLVHALIGSQLFSNCVSL